MQVLSEFISGVRGAENGTARIYKRASSTEAVVYSNYDGSQALSQPIALDSYGGIECYVNEEVDVRVAAGDGTVIREFSPMLTANAVEYIGQSFTGKDYDDGASGVNKPTSVQAILDGWITSAGATDFEVIVNGVATTLKNAIASSAGVFFNVQSPEFGAVGDGADDDTIAIQAALNAAGTAGGGIVLFPAGTYRVTSRLDVPAEVSLWGVSMQVCIIVIDDPTADLIKFVGGGQLSEVRNLYFAEAQANTGTLITTETNNLRMYGCRVGGGSQTGDPIVVATGCSLMLDSCYVFINTSGGINAGFSSTYVELRNSFVASLTAAYTGALVTAQAGVIFGSQLSCGSSSSGANTCLLLNGTTSLIRMAVIGCDFVPPIASVLSIGVEVANANNANTNLKLAGNTFRSGFTGPTSGTGADTNNPQIQDLDREARTLNVSSNSATVATQAHLYGIITVERTAAGAGAQSITATVGPPGSFLTILIWNNTVGALAGDITLDAGFYVSTPDITKPGAGKVSIAQFRSIYAAGTAAWYPTGTYQNNI